MLETIKTRPGNAGVRLYGGATADLDSLCASASEIAVGAEKACGAIEQKKAPKQERKRLAPPCGKGLDNVSLHLCQTRSFPICFPRPAGVFAAFFGAQDQAGQGRDLSSLAPLRVLRARALVVINRPLGHVYIARRGRAPVATASLASPWCPGTR